jgi:hypothetical protein
MAGWTESPGTGRGDPARAYCRLSDIGTFGSPKLIPQFQTTEDGGALSPLS